MSNLCKNNKHSFIRCWRKEYNYVIKIEAKQRKKQKNNRKLQRSDIAESSGQQLLAEQLCPIIQLCINGICSKRTKNRKTKDKEITLTNTEHVISLPSLGPSVVIIATIIINKVISEYSQFRKTKSNDMKFQFLCFLFLFLF